MNFWMFMLTLWFRCFYPCGHKRLSNAARVCNSRVWGQGFSLAHLSLEFTPLATAVTRPSSLTRCAVKLTCFFPCCHLYFKFMTFSCYLIFCYEHILHLKHQLFWSNIHCLINSFKIHSLLSLNTWIYPCNQQHHQYIQHFLHLQRYPGTLSHSVLPIAQENVDLCVTTHSFFPYYIFL